MTEQTTHQSRAQEQMARYLEDGTLETAFLNHASSSAYRMDAYNECHWERNFGKEMADEFRANAELYKSISRTSKYFRHLIRLFEIGVWFGRPDLATFEEVLRWEEMIGQWDHGQKIVPGDGAVKTYWDSQIKRGHSAVCSAYGPRSFEAKLWGSAGRVLITLSRKSGEQVTVIFDESSEFPRGGIQSVYGKRNDVISLLEMGRALLDTPFTPDDKVTIG